MAGGEGPELMPIRRPRRKKPPVREMESLSVSDMAEAIGCCTDTVYRYIQDGVIKATRRKTAGGRSRLKIEREWALKYLQGSGGHLPVPKPRGPRGPAGGPRPVPVPH